jgi:hypothetical protein
MMKPCKATPNTGALNANSVALGLFHQLVSGIFESEDERSTPWPTGSSAEGRPVESKPLEVPPEPPAAVEMPSEPSPSRHRSERHLPITPRRGESKNS